MLNIGENVGINQDRITTVTETPQIFSILTELKKKFPLQYITMQWGKLKVGMCWSQGVVLHVVIQEARLLSGVCSAYGFQSYHERKRDLEKSLIPALNSLSPEMTPSLGSHSSVKHGPPRAIRCCKTYFRLCPGGVNRLVSI